MHRWLDITYILAMLLQFFSCQHSGGRTDDQRWLVQQLQLAKFWTKRLDILVAWVSS